MTKSKVPFWIWGAMLGSGLIRVRSSGKPEPRQFTKHDEDRIQAAVARRERREAVKAENRRRSAAGKVK